MKRIQTLRTETFGDENCEHAMVAIMFVNFLFYLWIFVLGQRFDHYECGRLSWLGQLYGAL